MNGSTMELATARYLAMSGACGSPARRPAATLDPSRVAALHLFEVPAAVRGTGPVLLVLTGGAADRDAAAVAAKRAARSERAVVVVPAIEASGFSLNALLHLARERRVQAERTRIVDQIAPILNLAGLRWSMTEPVMLPRPRARWSLRADILAPLLDRHAPAAVVSVVPVDPAPQRNQ